MDGLVNTDLDFFDHLFPRLDRVFQYGPGGCFGEIAILQAGIRAAGIFCDEETEFAIISKKTDNDFLFLYKAINKEKDKVLKNLSPFNYWIVRDKASVLFHLLEPMKKPIDTYLYKRGTRFFTRRPHHSHLPAGQRLSRDHLEEELQEHFVPGT